MNYGYGIDIDQAFQRSLERFIWDWLASSQRRLQSLLANALYGYFHVHR